ncbi:MAG: class I tRNA ligase family protein [Candidatus Paceibacterota bacterium]
MTINNQADNNQENKSSVAKREEATLAFWQTADIFAKTIETPAGAPPRGDFVFYDGPPFATGTPHFGHLLPTSLKDAIPRYQTMNGFRVKRRWGWDCHGLPVENIVEKDLALKNKKDIETYGIDKFNQAARESVLRYTHDWEKIVPRMGRFVDMTNDYRTMDSGYTESIWWIFKTLFAKGLIYEGFKSMHICPRCETTLANFEVNQGYQEIKDISVTVKLELIDEPGVYLLAWTTTPWTLPGNVAVAVNPEINYLRIKHDDGQYIVAAALAEKIFPAADLSTGKKIKGETLIGKKYRPLFPYYAEQDDLENKDNGWQVYGADFVTTLEGTGIVHLAPAFGEDDLRLAEDNHLPFIQHVGLDGKMKAAVKDFAGQTVKPKDDHSQTDILIIKYLAAAGTLFAKEKITHSYPHCWRCDTPLLNYAASSWFVKVTALKDQLIKANQTVNWLPSHIKDGRFGKWLAGARDWAISRSRFWGAPLPVWRCDHCDEVAVIGSVGELAERLTAKNTYTVMRHGESRGNLKSQVSSKPAVGDHLTERGRAQAEAAARDLVEAKIDLIIYSPLERTHETAEIVATLLGLPANQVIADEHFVELNTGHFPGGTWGEYWNRFRDRRDRLFSNPWDGESIFAAGRRAIIGLDELEKKYAGRNILIVTHAIVVIILNELNNQVGGDLGQVAERYIAKDYYVPGNADVIPLAFKPLPRNKQGELDLHRPYIDDVSLSCSACDGHLTRITDVFDCWFESGAMPYGQAHYPFTETDFKPEQGKGFPADFIAEGIDQTRGWFYSLLVLAVALFGRAPYKQVVTNGLLLASDGRKMSKRLNNYPDVNLMINQYGADALRLYLLGLPAVHGDDASFFSDSLAETYRRNILRLENVLAFYQLYAEREEFSPDSYQPTNRFDHWIVSLLTKATRDMTEAFDRYEIDRITRLIDDFIDNLSTWYIRRSRERFKSDDSAEKKAALETTAFVLFNLSRLIAPIMPFLAEHIYQSLNLSDREESVHLTSWPDSTTWSSDEELLEQMTVVRNIVEEALRQRSEAGLKVRQPLSRLVLKSEALVREPELIQLICAEVNVKTVDWDKNQEAEVWLDPAISPELQLAGQVRELVRQVQILRKEADWFPTDRARLTVATEVAGQAIIRAGREELRQVAGVGEIDFKELSAAKTVTIDEIKFNLAITKL